MMALKYPVVNNFLYNKLGIDQFKINSSDSGGTTITVGKRIKERFLISTMFNMNPDDDENELELQIDMSLGKHSTLGTKVGDENSSLGVFWQIPVPNKKDDTVKVDKKDEHHKSGE
jgi:autotransporter translocation and assembly factor TamB